MSWILHRSPQKPAPETILFLPLPEKNTFFYHYSKPRAPSRGDFHQFTSHLVLQVFPLHRFLPQFTKKCSNPVPLVWRGKEGNHWDHRVPLKSVSPPSPIPTHWLHPHTWIFHSPLTLLPSVFLCHEPLSLSPPWTPKYQIPQTLPHRVLVSNDHFSFSDRFNHSFYKKSILV